MQQAWIFMVILIGVGYAVAFTRKGRVAGTGMTSRQQVVASPASPAEVFAALSQIGAPFRVDDAHEPSKMLVLSSSVTLFSWGFLYPIVITPTAKGSQIVVGCGSKLFQIGPVVTNAHDKCVAAVKAALSAAPARVVSG